MRPGLLEAARNEVLLADGAIGTELLRLGLKPGGLSEAWNIEHPQRVRAVHSAYHAAGARLMTTNSFGANRHLLAKHNLESQVAELNRKAGEIARAAVKDGAWVLGSIGPSGGLLEPLGPVAARDAHSWFAEQARGLLEGGVDGIVIETMTSREELEEAIRAAREAGAPVIIAMMAFGKGKNGYRTIMGVSPRDAVDVMQAAGADILGCNCGQGLSVREYAEIVSEFRGLTEKPLIVRPNAGRPELVEQEAKYSQTPELMANEIPELVRAGANIIGGCCGTTPEHIRHFDLALRKTQP